MPIVQFVFRFKRKRDRDWYRGQRAEIIGNQQQQPQGNIKVKGEKK